GRAALSVRGLGVTQAVAGYPALPAVAEELCSIVHGPIDGMAAPSDGCNGALRGAGYADAAFTEQRLTTLLGPTRDFSVLHLGTHFSLRPGNALRSFLVLGDGTKLTLDRLGALDFGGIELLTLSACQTGAGGAVSEDGREVEGLSALVQRRGARRVVASLWQVEDTSTARLMRAMYRALDGTASDVPRALQKAQLGLRSFQEGGARPYAHPYYWAGFVVSGSAP
ncbi:MAG TPA: CHAT domain-containing protein, partial [Candidatus Polarisedimenticolaceae bacterium]|nr:CHAT domain-containing protein [Candidatus Polarisedimenticolaceae bacterium]